jgi:hypothetical protein
VGETCCGQSQSFGKCTEKQIDHKRSTQKYRDLPFVVSPLRVYAVLGTETFVVSPPNVTF